MIYIATYIYWAIVALWLTVLASVVYYYVRNPRAFGTTRLLLMVIGIDTLRNIAVHKCHDEAGRGCLVVALIPARPDSNYWHDYVAGPADVFMLRGRLKFGDGENSAPFPSCVVVWGADPELISRISAALTNAWHIPRKQVTVERPSNRLLVNA